MHSAGEKIKNAASGAKEHLDIGKAKLEEKVDKATARTSEEKHIASEMRKAKEAEAKMELHEAKARHAAEKLQTKHGHAGHHAHAHQPLSSTPYGNVEPGTTHAQAQHGHQPGGVADPMSGATVPTYPLGGHTTAHKYM